MVVCSRRADPSGESKKLPLLEQMSESAEAEAACPDAATSRIDLSLGFRAGYGANARADDPTVCQGASCTQPCPEVTPVSFDGAYAGATCDARHREADEGDESHYSNEIAENRSPGETS